MEDAGVGDINISAERYESAISSVMARNHDRIDEVMLGVGNPQDEDSAFLVDNNFMQARIANLSACLNEELFGKILTDRTVKGKLAMEVGSICIDNICSNCDDLMFESSAAHAETPKGVTAL